MKFYCVKCRITKEVPDNQVKEYIPTDIAKAECMKKANRKGYVVTCEKCGTKMYTFRTKKKA